MIVSRAIACNACGSVHSSLQRVCKGFRVVSCDDCGLLYVNPMPFFDKSNFHSVSREFFYTSQQSEIAPTKMHAVRREFVRQAEEWRKMLEPTVEAPKLIDVGCGPGLFIKAAQEHGWRAEGCDIDEQLVKLGKRKLAAPLRHADLIEADFPSDCCDVVRFKYVLEHLPHPLEVLRETYRVLKPGGLTMIIVPNEAGAVNRLRVRLGAKNGGRHGTLTPPHHLHAYTPHTLRRLLRRAGFELAQQKTVTPKDRGYALYRESWSMGEHLMAPVWKAAQMVGRGSALVAYGRKV